MILQCTISLRGAGNTLAMLSPLLAEINSTPSWYTVRIWLLRLGCYKLLRPKKIADDWIWLVDHSIQIGTQKCLLILGVRKINLPEERSLTFDDMEPINLIPVTQSNGRIVFEQLEATIEKTGTPSSIVGDQGSDLKAGIKKFCDKYPATRYIHDVKHMTALVLKQVLEKDERWPTFKEKTRKIKKALQQTKLAALAPPNQRSKARYMNVDILFNWATKMLAYINGPEKIIQEHFDIPTVKEKFSWLNDYSDALSEWNGFYKMASQVEHTIRTKGITQHSGHQLSKYLCSASLNIVETQRTVTMKEMLIKRIQNESSKVQPQERLLGSSEVIESAFGKYKEIEGYQSKSGFTHLILALPAVFGKINGDIIESAMKQTSTKIMQEWCKEQIGNSIQSMKKKIFKKMKKSEHISDELLAAG